MASAYGISSSNDFPIIYPSLHENDLVILIIHKLLEKRHGNKNTNDYQVPIKNSLCAKHCSEHFTYINSYGPHNNCRKCTV